MERALERGKTNWGYVKAILRKWQRSGRSGGSGQEEIVPEWFMERERELKADAKKEQAGSVLSKEEEEVELSELRKLVKGDENPEKDVG